MSKLNRLQKIIVGVIATFVLIGILIGVIGGSTTSNLGYSGLTMLKYALIDHPTATLKDWMNDFSTLWAVKEENDQLNYELSQNPSYKAKMDELENEVNELRALLEMESTSDLYQYINADVITRDQASWHNQIVINRGTNDGLKKGMSVVSVNGMVGAISEVSQHTATATLLTSQNGQSKPPIKINIDGETASEGILDSYDIAKGMYKIRLFTDSDQIKEGMQVVTSGKGGVYPAGLLVGNVDTVQSLTNSVGQIIYATPVDNFQTFSYVGVIGNSGE